jgi:hypothetical protein
LKNAVLGKAKEMKRGRLRLLSEDTDSESLLFSACGWH